MRRGVASSIAAEPERAAPRERVSHNTDVDPTRPQTQEAHTLIRTCRITGRAPTLHALWCSRLCCQRRPLLSANGRGQLPGGWSSGPALGAGADLWLHKSSVLGSQGQAASGIAEAHPSSAGLTEPETFHNVTFDYILGQWSSVVKYFRPKPLRLACGLPAHAGKPQPRLSGGEEEGMSHSKSPAMQQDPSLPRRGSGRGRLTHQGH